MRVSVLLLVCIFACVTCQGSRQTARQIPKTCEEKRALWDAEFPRLPPDSPRARIKAIEAIAEQIGEDPEQCTADLIRKALQAERVRLVTLRIAGARVAPAAVYTCAALSDDLKCSSSVADDTAHLGETLTAAMIPLAGGERAQLDADASLSNAEIRVYAATMSALMDAPKYIALALDGSRSFTVPKVSEEMVLFAVVNEPDSNTYDKFVWLARPR